MNQYWGRNTIRIISCMIAGIFVLLIANKALYTHSHRLADGSIVNHAHPFSKSTDNQPFQQHRHSDLQLVFLHHADLLFPVLFLALTLFLIRRQEQSVCYQTAFEREASISGYQGRAPPVLV